jgi:hypothetical protein
VNKLFPLYQTIEQQNVEARTQKKGEEMTNAADKTTAAVIQFFVDRRNMLNALIDEAQRSSNYLDSVDLFVDSSETRAAAYVKVT